MVVRQLASANFNKKRWGHIFGGAAFLAALIPLYAPHHLLDTDMTGMVGDVVTRVPLGLCLFCAFATSKDVVKPWWALLSIPLAFPKTLGFVLTMFAWTFRGFAP